MIYIKQIVFVEDPVDNGFELMIDMVNNWYRFNQQRIKLISAIYGVDENERTPNEVDYRRTIVIRYTGEAGTHPQDCEHQNKNTETIPPTCFSTGGTEITCKDCGIFIGSSVLEKVDHEYIYISDNNATCTGDGTETGTCKYCGKKVRRLDVGSAHGHNYIYTSDDNATCTEDGTETGKCSYCNDTKIRIIPGSAVGHTYEYNYNNDATCLDNGTETATCPNCDDQKTRVVPDTALGHDLPNIWSVQTPPSYEYMGLEVKECSRCDYYISQNIPKLIHNWVSNGNGTHRCTTVGGCGVTETCYPNNYGNVCSKCGYVTPEDTELIITTDYVNGMTVGNFFTQTLECNITNSVAWSLAAGALPPGITCSHSGIISGTPTASGIFNFTIQVVYHAQIVTKSFSVNVANVIYTVTFDPKGGSASETTRQVPQGSTIGTLPTASLNGFDFGGWFTAPVDGLKIDANYSVSSNVTLYARWGQGTDIEFGDATSQFNIHYDGDRTNYNDMPYTIYHKATNGTGADNLVVQVGISSSDRTNNMTQSNNDIRLYLKITNNGAAGNFDIGFDCDSYVKGDDRVKLLRIADGVQLGSYFQVTIPYDHTVWVGQYGERTIHRYDNSKIGHSVGSGTISNIDTGYTFTVNNTFINSKSYVILEFKFQLI